jgi:hypothetical protein
MVFRWSSGGALHDPLPLVNNYWLSITLLLVVVAGGAALFWERQTPAVDRISIGGPDPTS